MMQQVVRMVTPLTAAVLMSVCGCSHCGAGRTSLRVPLPPGPCCGPRSAAYGPAPGGHVIVGQPSAPLPVVPNGVPPGSPPAAGSWQPWPNGVQPRVVESRPLPVPAPEPGTRLLPPDQANARLQTPQADENLKPAAEKPSEAAKDAADFPADIPQFNPVYDKVASGMRPFRGGFEWLKARGYKTVLYLRTPGEDEAADRGEVERLGMKYLSLDVGPLTLNAELLKQFAKIVQDADAQPLFVYDRKGMQSGALWYLHFRLADNLPEAQARAKAMRLGLKEEAAGEYADFWLAINQILRGI